MEESVTILTRTPLWTASRDSGKMEAVQASAIIGGLRWWYEAIVRGMGYYTCDPSDQNSACQKKDDEPPAKLCPACQLFGTTGWARRFNLQLTEIGRVYPWPGIPIGRITAKASECYNQKRENYPTFFFPEGFSGEITLRIVEKFSNSENISLTICSLLDLISKCGGLGAKTGLGYGLFRLIKKPENLLEENVLLEKIKVSLHGAREGKTSELPSLDKFLICNIRTKNPWNIKDFVNFKCKLRADFRKLGNTYKYKKLRHYLLGYVEDENAIASKVKMGLYPGGRIFKIWGWIPDNEFFFDEMTRGMFIDFFK